MKDNNLFSPEFHSGSTQESTPSRLPPWIQDLEEPAVTAFVFVMVGIIAVFTYPARRRDRIRFQQ